MTDFLLKSTLCLVLLFAVYFFLLEKEKMHRFNRFFLLSSLIFSLAIPFISFEIYVGTIEGIQQNTFQGMPISTEMSEEKTDYLPIILWCLYGLPTTILAFRFVANLIKIKQKINSSPHEIIQNASLVLLNEKVLPHTFLNCIFINKSEYENRKIEDELYTHELTHVRQKHTLDILFIEILKILFWFNPILILYKKAIQLNHEFLADEKVVKSHNNVPFYQNLLLEKASWNNTFYLASNLNFLVTKKRLIMMTRKTSKVKATILQLSIIPLAAVLLLSCSIKLAVQPNSEISATTSKIEVLNVSNTEMDSLHKMSPKVYANEKASDYQKTKLTSLDREGHIAITTSYEKKPIPEIPIILPKTPLDNLQISRIESEQVAASDPSVMALRAAHPEAFSKDPNVNYQATKMKFTLKDSSVVEKIGFQKLAAN